MTPPVGTIEVGSGCTSSGFSACPIAKRKLRYHFYEDPIKEVWVWIEPLLLNSSRCGGATAKNIRFSGLPLATARRQMAETHRYRCSGVSFADNAARSE